MVIDIISYYIINNCGGLNLCPLDLYIMYWAWALYQLGYSYFILLNRSFQGFCLDFIVISNAFISCCITHRQTECLNLLRVFISCVTHRQTESHTSLWVFICYVTHRQTEYLNLMRVSISCVTHRQTESLGDRLTNKRNINID